MATKPNYISHLQGLQRDSHHLADQALNDLNELKAYLSSPKFWSDPTVQVKDVLARLEPACSTLLTLSYLTHTNAPRRLHDAD